MGPGALSDLPSLLTPPVLLLDCTGIITHATKPALALWGYHEAQQMVGRRSHEFWVEPEEAADEMKKFLETGVWQGSFLSRKSDGSTIQIYGKSWKVEGEGEGKDARIVMLASSSESTLGLFEMFGQAGTVILPEIVVKGALHDLRNVLSIPMGLISILREEFRGNSSNVTADLNGLEAACNHMRDILDQMGTWLVSWADKSPGRKTVSIGKLVSQAVSMATLGANMEVKTDVANNLGAVHCEETGIFRVLVNLVLNAREASGPRGILVVKAERAQAKKGFVKISIKDSGKGISKENLARLFTPGFTTREDGRGIGLAISDHIVREHGGYVEAHSKLGKGTTFEIFLPVVSARK